MKKKKDRRSESRSLVEVGRFRAKAWYINCDNVDARLGMDVFLFARFR